MIPRKYSHKSNYFFDLACLEECLKYVLLLNFDEEPKYDYLVEELKKAYIQTCLDAGDKPSTSAFKTPIFDWNVSLATRFQKVLSSMEDHWKDGESNVGKHNLSLLNKTLLKSRLILNFHGAGSGSSNHDSYGSHAFVSPMSSNDFAKQQFGLVASSSNHNSKDVLDNQNRGGPSLGFTINMIGAQK